MRGNAFLAGLAPNALTALIASLFSAGEQGAIYDPSTLISMYQDSAGTTPVYQPGQGSVDPPVGKILDLSPRANHATQATAINRPRLSGLVNTLLRTEDFSNAAWTKTSGIVTGIADPKGGTNAVRITSTSTLSELYQGVVGANVTNRSGWWVRRVSGTGAVRIYDPISSTYTDITAGLTTSWQFFTSAATLPNAGTTAYTGISMTTNGDVVEAAFPQLLTGSVVTSGGYQRVVDANTYDTAGFPLSEVYNGTNSSLAAAAGGGGTLGFFFCQAIQVKGAVGTARTLWSDTGTNTGYRVRINTSNQLELAAGNGTTYTTIATVATLAVGTTQLVTAWDDGVNLNVQVDANTVASVARPTVSAGTAAFTLGSDNGAASSFFNGSMFAEVYRKDSGLTAPQRTQAQAYCKSKAGL